jgi:hypothetical protein
MPRRAVSTIGFNKAFPGIFTRNCAVSEPVGTVTEAAKAMVSSSLRRPTGAGAVAGTDRVITHKELPPGFTVLGAQTKLVRPREGVGDVLPDKATCAVLLEPFRFAVILAT